MRQGGQRARAGAALEAGDRHMIGARLRDAGRNRADTDLRYQLHRDRRLRVGVLQIVDQLREILDRIDVVVRRRRDELHARRREAQLGDVLGDLAPRKLAAFAGLRALRDLDLQHLGAGEVLSGDAEAARGDLLDLRLERVAFAQREVDFDPGFAQTRLEAFAGLDWGIALA